MTFFITSIPHENCRHFRSDEHFYLEELLMSVDDFCRSLVLPSEAKIVDRSHRVALHKPLFRNCLMRGDRAALHTSFLRTWTAFLTRYCSRVVFDPPVLPFVRCAHNDCQTMPLHQHRSTIFKHFRPQHPFRLKSFLVLSILSTCPVFSSVELRSVFCAVVLSTCLRVRATVGKKQMCTCRARGGCQNLASTMQHGVPTMWTTTTQSWPMPCQHKHFLASCGTSPTSRRFLPLCWYASKAGMSDDVRRTGFRLDAPSGHNQRHLDSVLDFAKRQSQFYKLQVVGTRKQDDSRSTFDMCVVPGHEVFNAEVEGDAWLSGRLCHAKTTNGLPKKKNHEHPVVKRTPTKMCAQSLCTWMWCPTR